MSQARRLAGIALAATLLGCAGSPSASAPSPTRDAHATAAATIAPTSGASAAPLATPSCRAPATLTTAQTEGPYFKAGSPERSVLVQAGMSGTRLVLAGFVLSTACRPVAGAKLDFWQADANGTYDNAGYTLRGHQFTDAQGRYRLETVVPGEYPGRTPHIHVKVQAPGRSALTSQVYFPDARANASDSIFRPELVVKVEQAGPPLLARFDFVVDAP